MKHINLKALYILFFFTSITMYSCSKDDDTDGTSTVALGKLEAKIGNTSFIASTGFIDDSSPVLYIVGETEGDGFLIRIDGYDGPGTYGPDNQGSFMIYKDFDADGGDIWHTADQNLGSGTVVISSDSGSGADKKISGTFSFTTGKSIQYPDGGSAVEITSANVAITQGKFNLQQRSN